MRVAAQVHAEGRDPAYRNLALYYIVTYLAALEIGAGRDGLDLLDIGDFPPVPNLLPEAVASIIRESLPTAVNRSEQDWPVFWSQMNAPSPHSLRGLRLRVAHRRWHSPPCGTWRNKSC